MTQSHNAHDAVVASTRAWLEQAVIGLNLCPFARAVHVRGQIRYCVSEACTPEALLEDLEWELGLLAAADPEVIATTLLIHPGVLQDFLEFNDFLDLAEAAIDRLGLEGVVQVASFHPQYRFDGTDPDDITNYTNRSPFPTLHLLREDAVERAVATLSDPGDIFRRNIETMRRLGITGWRALDFDRSRLPKSG